MSQKQVLNASSVPSQKFSRPAKVGLFKLLPKAGSIARDSLKFLQQTAYQKGDVVRLVANIYLINNPDYIEQILTTTNRNFIKGINKPGKKPRTFAGNGLVLSEGDLWLRQRRLAQPAFHHKRIAGYAETMIDYTFAMLNNWGANQTLDVQKEITQLTLNIVGKTLFNADMSNQGDTMAKLLANFANTPGFVPPLPGKKRRQILQAQKEFDATLFKLIAERRLDSEDKGDLLSMFLAVRDNDGSQMNDQQVRDELITMITAGHETTAISLVWLFYLLAKNPAVRTKIQEEIALVSGGHKVTLEDLPKLKYCEAVIKETLRLYPPAWGLARRTVKNTVLGNYQIKKGSHVVISPYVTQRDSRFFTTPDDFMPERWLTENIKPLPKYAYFPFGGGPRVCIGQPFAQMEMLLVLAVISQHFQLELTESTTEVRPKVGVTLRPSTPLVFKAILLA